MNADACTWRWTQPSKKPSAICLSYICNWSVYKFCQTSSLPVFHAIMILLCAPLWDLVMQSIHTELFMFYAIWQAHTQTNWDCVDQLIIRNAVFRWQWTLGQTVPQSSLSYNIWNTKTEIIPERCFTSSYLNMSVGKMTEKWSQNCINVSDSFTVNTCHQL